MLNKKDFLKYASKLAFPIMIQNLIGTLVNIADTVMLGYVSQTAMAASSLANQYTFILFCLYYGMATGTSVLCAQYWGKGDKKTVERILGLAERISLIVSLVFFVISFSMPTTIMKIFTSSPDTIAAGSEYLRVISFSFMFMGFSQVFMSALRSIGKIMLPSVTYIVSLCVNVICNATFIFGLFGLPKLGVTGVALGTVIARITEVLICLIYSLRSSDVRFRIKYFFAKSGILFQDFMKIATPAVINDVVWSFASSAFAAILGHIGDDMVAANAVAVMVVNIGAIACRGFANATTIIVSQELGKDNIDTAREYGKRMLRITMVVSLVGCVIILALRPLILDFYRDKLTEMAIYYLGIFIIMTTWRLVGEGINTCLICGCFRGGGDSRFGMIIDSIFMWLVAVPLTFLAAYVLKLPPIWVYFVMTLDEFEKCLWYLFTISEANGSQILPEILIDLIEVRNMTIRKAKEKDIPRIIELLGQVLQIHADIRPDIFIPGTTKYTVEELTELLKNKEKPIYVAVNESDVCVGYAFCQLQKQPFSNNMVQFKSLFIDDLCVDQQTRGQHIGESLFEHVKKEARKMHCYEVTLNVWSGNTSAEKFYEKMGMKTKERQMEYILDNL